MNFEFEIKFFCVCDSLEIPAALYVSIFFLLKNIKKGEQLLLLSYFNNFDF